MLCIELLGSNRIFVSNFINKMIAINQQFKIDIIISDMKKIVIVPQVTFCTLAESEIHR